MSQGTPKMNNNNKKRKPGWRIIPFGFFFFLFLLNSLPVTDPVGSIWRFREALLMESGGRYLQLHEERGPSHLFPNREGGKEQGRSWRHLFLREPTPLCTENHPCHHFTERYYLYLWYKHPGRHIGNRGWKCACYQVSSNTSLLGEHLGNCCQILLLGKAELKASSVPSTGWP